jgi:hypothetical protein
MDPERPGHHFFDENVLDITAKELKVCTKKASDSLRFSLYQIIPLRCAFL